MRRALWITGLPGSGKSVVARAAAALRAAGDDLVVLELNLIRRVITPAPISASAPAVPPALLAQLALGGRLVIPVGESLDEQQLVRVVRTGQNDDDREVLEQVAFVPLIGAEGWAEDPAQAR